MSPRPGKQGLRFLRRAFSPTNLELRDIAEDMVKQANDQATQRC